MSDDRERELRIAWLEKQMPRGKGYKRHLRAGPKTEVELRKELAERSMPIPFCGCLIWMGQVEHNGYSTIFTGATNSPPYYRRKLQAHRLAYELAKGRIPDGLDIDHLCRIRSCINPDHLEPVTREENLRRGIGGDITRRRHQTKTHCPRGHPYDGDNLSFTTLKGRYQARVCRRCKAEAARRRRAAK